MHKCLWIVSKLLSIYELSHPDDWRWVAIARDNVSMTFSNNYYTNCDLISWCIISHGVELSRSVKMCYFLLYERFKPIKFNVYWIVKEWILFTKRAHPGKNELGIKLCLWKDNRCIAYLKWGNVPVCSYRASCCSCIQQQPVLATDTT